MRDYMENIVKNGGEIVKSAGRSERGTEVNGGVLLCLALRSKQIAFAID